MSNSNKEHDLFRSMHDCGPRALLRVVPELQETQIRDAFTLCSEKWPYGGVCNKEFEIAVKHLGVEHRYNHSEETLQDLLDRKPHRCVALLDGHFVAIKDGELEGNEFLLSPPSETKVFCSWTFH